MPVNDRDFLYGVVEELYVAGIGTWIFGGWAEELRGIIAPRPHGDIDLLYPITNLRVLDDYLARPGVEEIPGKRLPHKRAFIKEGVVIELFLIDPATLITRFWGSIEYRWPEDTLSDSGHPMIASRAALEHYRASWEYLRARPPLYLSS